MIFEIQNHTGEPLSKLAESLIERRKAKLEKFLSNFSPDAVSLHLIIEEVKKKHLFNTRLVLNVPGKTLRAEKQHKDLVYAIGESFDALTREVKKYKEFFRKEPEFKRKRATYQEAIPAEEITQEVREIYLDFVESLYPRLWNFTVREIRHRIDQGLLRPGELSAQDILDEAIVTVGNELPEEYDEHWVKRQLYRNIVRIINREVINRRMRGVSLEKPLRMEDLDTQLYEYYQPDNVVLLEDVIPADESETPESQFELETLEEALEKALTLLPNTWRQAFMLTQLENFTPEEVAMIQGRDPETVRKEAAMARAFIQEKLQEMGIEWEEEKGEE